MSRHLVIAAHTDDELVFMSPAMLDILRGPAAVHLVYLTAGDAGLDEAYWRSREVAIAQAHQLLRPPPAAASAGEVGDLTYTFVRLADGMLDGQGSAVYRHESLTRLWRGTAAHVHALDARARYTRDSLVALLRDIAVKFRPTLIHTLNGLANEPGEHPDHHAAGLFAIAAVADLPAAVPMRFYLGSNSPHKPANVSGAALADKLSVFATYAQNDATIFNERADWLSSSIYYPMLERQYFTECMSSDLAERRRL